MCVHVYVDTRIDVVWLYQMLCILIYRRVTLGGPEPAYLATMAEQWSPGILLSLTPTPSLGLQICCCTQLLRGCWRVKFRYPCLSGKHFNHWVTSPTVCDLLKSTALPLPRTNLSLPPKKMSIPTSQGHWLNHQRNNTWACLYQRWIFSSNPQNKSSKSKSKNYYYV